MTGICGSSGSGNSSILQLIELYDSSSPEVSMDAENITSFDLIKYRQMIGYISLIWKTQRCKYTMVRKNHDKETISLDNRQDIVILLDSEKMNPAAQSFVFLSKFIFFIIISQLFDTFI